jgi:hypothetical protein
MQRIFLAVFLSSLTLYAALAAATQEAPRADAIYRNENYGYEVTIPLSIKIRRSVPPNPDHGFEVISVSHAKLWVDASYTDSATNVEEAERQADGCHTSERRQTSLGGKPAIEIRFSCPGTANESAYTEFLAFTVQKQGDRANATYEVGVREDSGKLSSHDIELARKLISGFSFTR